MEWINVNTKKPPLDTDILILCCYKYGYLIYKAEYVRPRDKKRPVFASSVQREEKEGYPNGYVYEGYPHKEVKYWSYLPDLPLAVKKRYENIEK